MRVTIIKEDNTVLVDGERHTVDCSDLPADFHALQWSGFAGEVEYSATRCDHCGVRSKKGNVLITDVSPYQSYVDAWHEAKTKAELAERAADAA
jgi:transcription elongation factor Elf1